MCGRFALASLEKEIIDEFDVSEPIPNYRQSYNIAPAQDVFVIAEPGTITTMRWGLIPHWAKDEKIGYKMINARAETLAEKPTFKKPFAKQRCIIIASGFFEWENVGGTKQPYYIRLKSDTPFGFAGMYDIWTSKEGKTVHSCTIITTTPNPLLKKIHDRMPVMLKKHQRKTWLSQATEEKQLQSLLRPYPQAELQSYRVAEAVNSPRNNSRECINPIPF